MAELRYLKDADGNIIYPVTHTDAIIGDINNNNDNNNKYQTITDTNLSTENKTVVGAINEIYQNVNNGKQLIASAIGNPLVTNKSTFEAMSEAILNLRSSSDNETDAKEVLYNMMIEDGYDEATSNMTVDDLIQLLDDSNIDKGDIKQIVCAYARTFILKNDGSVWACGGNSSGELGLGDTDNRTSFTQVTDISDVKKIVCGDYHTFIIKNDETLWTCGDNNYGQLGLGDTDDRTTFTQVTTNINNDVKQVSCGYEHTFILKNNGSVWACGNNGKGQLGLGDTTDRTTLTQVTTNIDNDANQIVCGGFHTVISKNNDSVWACGFNNKGQLGLGDTTDRTTFTQVTTNIDNDVKQIACGFRHVIIIKNDGSVWGCGDNASGQLGLNDTDNRTTFTQVTTNINNDVNQIACGTHTFILKNDDSVWACGFNTDGQLGLGDTTDRTIFTQIPLSSQSIDDNEINRLKLYYYLLDNEIEVTKSMDIGTMLDLLVDDYINNAIIGHENNLRLILANEGVDVSEEDDMTSLITKIDEEFDRQVVPEGTAVASNVLANKTFINSTGDLVTGNMTNQGSKTITPRSTNQTLAAGYYSGITINGNANLKAANIVEGVTIFGVTGTAKTGGYYFNSDETGVAEVTLHQDNGQQTYSTYGTWSTIISLYTSTIEGKVKFVFTATSGGSTVRVKKISGSTTTYPDQITVSSGYQSVYSLTVDIAVGDKIQLEVNPSQGYPFYKYGVTIVTNICSY